MDRRITFLSAFAALSIASLPAVSSLAAQNQSQSDQSEARAEMQAGNVLSLRQIEARILPQMRGSEYLGPSYDSTARAYRLKFIKDGRVSFVDVDARTGQIINRSR
ncbi:MAG: PepSY domain-containing protein [Erythrobacter sp.]